MSGLPPAPIRSGLSAQLRAACEGRLPSTLQALQQMVGINSFTLNADGVNRLAKLTADVFAPLGFVSESVAAENHAHGRHLVLSRAGAGGETVAFISHLDTVFTAGEEQANDFCWRVEGDRIYGPGTVDIKGGTMVAHLTLAALKECSPQLFEEVHWLVLLNSAEEVPSPDFGSLCRDRIPAAARAALVMEGGAWAGASHCLVTARKGRALFRVEVEGRSAHAGGNHDRGANAIAQLAHTVQRIEALTDYSRELTFNVGVISGGSVVNRVPERAWAEVEMRAFEPGVYAQGMAALRAVASEVVVRSATDQHPCRVKIELMSENLPWPMNPATESLFQVWQAAGRALGLTVVRENRGGVSDGNHIWDHVPTLDGLGPCGEHSHCARRDLEAGMDQEYVEIPTVVTRAWLNAVALHRLLAGS